YLEKRKEHEPDCLAIPFVAHKARFPVIRQIGIMFVVPLMRMMLQMIDTESHGAGSQIWKIGDNGHDLVPAFAPKNQIVSRVVNDDVIGMICERANAISDQSAQPPVTEAKISHSVRNARLHYYDRNRNKRSPWIAHHQLPDFRMGFDD